MTQTTTTTDRSAPADTHDDYVLEINDLHTHFFTREGVVKSWTAEHGRELAGVQARAQRAQVRANGALLPVDGGLTLM